MASCARKFQILLLILSCLGLLTSCAKLIQPRIKTGIVNLKAGQYELDKEHASVFFKVKHMGFSKYVGRFNEFEAQLDFDVEDISKTRLSATVAMSSVDVNSEDIEEMLRGGDWFDVEHYPQAIFQTKGIKHVNEDELIFLGQLEFLGRTQSIDLHVKFNGGAHNVLTGRYTLGFEASSQFKRSDFGMDNYIPAVGDIVELEIHAEFQRN